MASEGCSGSRAIVTRLNMGLGRGVGLRVGVEMGVVFTFTSSTTIEFGVGALSGDSVGGDGISDDGDDGDGDGSVVGSNTWEVESDESDALRESDDTAPFTSPDNSSCIISRVMCVCFMCFVCVHNRHTKCARPFTEAHLKNGISTQRVFLSVVPRRRIFSMENFSFSSQNFISLETFIN